MKMKIAFILILLCYNAGYCKRQAPKPVCPVFNNGIRYEASDMNYIAAYDNMSNRLLWKQQVYDVKIDPNLEADVQWIFIKEIKIVNDSILITNEIDNKYLIALVPNFKIATPKNNNLIFIELLNNQSIAAFLGAMFAFVFMLLLDLIRKIWQLRSLNTLINLSAEMTTHKLATVKANVDSIKTKRELMPGSIMPFQVDDIMRSLSNVYDVISNKRKMSVDGIVHRMKGIDEILIETNRKILELRDMPDQEKLIDYTNGKRKGAFIIDRILLNFEEVRLNLDLLKKMINAYRKREFNKILVKGFQPSNVLD